MTAKDIEILERINKYAEENLAVYSYEYELPNGDIIDYLEMNHNIAVNSSSSSTAGNFEITMRFKKLKLKYK